MAVASQGLAAGQSSGGSTSAARSESGAPLRSDPGPPTASPVNWSNASTIRLSVSPSVLERYHVHRESLDKFCIYFRPTTLKGLGYSVMAQSQNENNVVKGLPSETVAAPTHRQRQSVHASAE